MLQLSAVLVVVIGIVLLGLYGFGVISVDMLATLFGVLVAGGYAGFRQAIESTGYKTFIVSGGMVLFGLLYQVFGLIGFEQFLVIEGILTAGGVATLIHASNKQGALTAANKIS